MAWREAVTLRVLREWLNKTFPARSKVSDGGIGDAAHASRSSDHNPWVKDRRGIGVYTARDFTHDPGKGIDCNWLAEEIRKRRPPQVKYIIWNKRICSSYPAKGFVAWAWRPYSGSNAHTKHLHVSVLPEPEYYDNPHSWGLRPPMSERPIASLADVAIITEEGQPIPETEPEQNPEAVARECPRCGVAFDISQTRPLDELCPDCGSLIDGTVFGGGKPGEEKDTATGDTSKTDPPKTEVQPTWLKGWYVAIAGAVSSSLGAAGTWYAGLSDIVQASIFIGGGIATGALILGVIWIKNQREERANQKDLALITARGSNV